MGWSLSTRVRAGWGREGCRPPGTGGSLQSQGLATQWVGGGGWLATSPTGPPVTTFSEHFLALPLT